MISHSLSPQSVRDRRQKLGWSQSELARASGVSQSSISTYESEVRDLVGASLIQIDQALTEAETPQPAQTESSS